MINKYLVNKEKLAKIELNYHLNINVYLDIIKYFKIINCISKNIKLKIRDKIQRDKKRYKRYKSQK